VLLYYFGDFAYQPAGFVIIAQLALLSHLIMLIFPILLINGTCNITQTVSRSNLRFLKSLFALSGSQSLHFRMPHIVLRILNRWLCLFNSIPYPSGFSVNRILNPFVFLLIV
jgi:hypothetical protein